VNYVSWVFRSYFGFSRAEADVRMLRFITTDAVVAIGGREEMERHVEAMHDFGCGPPSARQTSEGRQVKAFRRSRHQFVAASLPDEASTLSLLATQVSERSRIGPA
jgi:hypothetical protein